MYVMYRCILLLLYLDMVFQWQQSQLAKTNPNNNGFFSHKVVWQWLIYARML